MKNFKVKSVFNKSVKNDDGTWAASLFLNDGHEVVLRECWFKEVKHNGTWNTYAITGDGFFVRVKLRKPQNSSGFHSGKSLESEIQRALVIAQKIIIDLGMVGKLDPQQ